MGVERTVHRPGEEISFSIPAELVREFKEQVRVVIRHPWIVGIPIPELLIKPEIMEKLKGFDVMLVPR